MSLPQHIQQLGLTRNPFPQTPDASCYFFTEATETGLMEIGHCIEAGKGFVLVTGEVGTGKSTLTRRLMADLEARQMRLSLVLNTFLQGAELLAAINQDFGLEPAASLSQSLERLNRFLLDQHASGHQCAIIIDDAQNLELASLELLRQLSNLETDQQKLLQIVLVGQPELLDALNAPELRQLTSRIAQHVRLRHLQAEECLDYLRFRLQQCGGDGRIQVTERAARCLHRLTAGNPRRIHLIMDRCLYGLIAQGQQTVDSALLRQASQDCQLQPPYQHGDQRPWWKALAAAVVTASLVLWLLESSEIDTTTGGASAVAAIAALAPSSTLEQPAAKPAFSSGQTGASLCLASLATTAVESDQQLRSLQLETPLSAEQMHYLEGCQQPDGQGWQVAWLSSYSSENFAFGERNSDAARLQQWLAKHDHYQLEIDGIIGAGTVNALASFQRANGLAVTGYPDSHTVLLLEHPGHRAGNQGRDGLLSSLPKEFAHGDS